MKNIIRLGAFEKDKHKVYNKKTRELLDVLSINFDMETVVINNGLLAYWDFDDIEILEYVGEFNKNIKLYTGNIVKVYWLAELGIEELDCNAIGVVEFDKEYSEYKIRLLKEYKRAVGGIGYYTETEIPLIHLNDREDDEQPYEYEVIGNIYQDKHLLEETNK